MLLFIVSCLSLIIGPLLSDQFRRYPLFVRSLNSVSILLVMGGIGLHIIPESVEAAGAWVLLLALAGFVLPNLVEHVMNRAAKTVHHLTLLVGVIGLSLHAALDGLALTEDAYVLSAGVLPAVVLLHRFPVGQVMWTLLEPAFGRGLAAAVLLVLMLMTGLGVLLGEQVHFLVHGEVFSWFQAFMAGALIHVMLFRSHSHHHD